MIATEFEHRLLNVRSHYRVSPWISPRADEAPLLRSWQRCRDAGMREHESVNFELVGRAMLAELDDEWGPLVRSARPETERLASAVGGAGGVVMLFNPRGVIIDRMAHDSVVHPVLRLATRVGMNVAERCVGTTAPGIALAEGLPYLVGREAHFFANLRPFFCVAAPVDGPRGERLAALDITCYDNVPGFDVQTLVQDAALAIENRQFVPGDERVVVHFHPRAEMVDTAHEALLMVDAAGSVVGANRSACRLLNQPRGALLGRPFTQCFDRRLGALFGASLRRQGGDLVEMHSHDGLLVMARFESAPRGGTPAAAPPPSPNLAGLAPGHPAAGAPSEAEAETRLRDLELRAIHAALDAQGGNVSAAARRLGISRSTIYRRLGTPATGH
ncbi:helix-turn-helix domain-containing protein [Aquabacterium sp. OR-4]|uniref:helix-turn-helix domain-containing protein n=1 Tax=Aquabacterium sp. OR-4 TaxID=2978127 RepID=UPI0021B22CBB|nr:helix-turn-helix domain-containing protein [Aquabacterium sp. OR-4]MDT7834062.1 helix-turn-helix domain-containing protein [Aquabacterium sp. OR-4]